ncbi:unnamed protein product, partial [Ixodes persulcatus]
ESPRPSPEQRPSRPPSRHLEGYASSPLRTPSPPFPGPRPQTPGRWAPRWNTNPPPPPTSPQRLPPSPESSPPTLRPPTPGAFFASSTEYASCTTFRSPGGEQPLRVTPTLRPRFSSDLWSPLADLQHPAGPPRNEVPAPPGPPGPTPGAGVHPSPLKSPRNKPPLAHEPTAVGLPYTTAPPDP